ncbi:MAG: PQQ-dependent sugar dehydrogenase [Chloroflexi bacterium]|nr:PQQ-dependent sugar dehydrogenase [Chloroflexota bacterium]
MRIPTIPSNERRGKGSPAAKGRRTPSRLEQRRRALHTLEFDKVRDILASHASFSLSVSLAQELEPSYTLPEVDRLQGEARDAGRLLELRPGLSLANAHDIRHLARTAALHGALTGAELLEVAETLATVHSVGANLMRLASDLHALGAIAAGLGDFRELEASIGRTLNSQGEVVDRASHLLHRLRSEERTAHDRLQGRLQEIIGSPEGRRLLQEPFVTTRNDRYVLAVRSEHRGQFQGLIHDISSSGATVFMEPLTTVELGNAWRELKLSEQREAAPVIYRALLTAKELWESGESNGDQMRKKVRDILEAEPQIEVIDYVSVADGGQTQRSQQLDSLLGKVVRTTLDGKPVSDNPFYENDDVSRAANFVWAYGLRNPFGLKMVDDRVFVADNGPDVDRFLEVEEGNNYLWDAGTSASAPTPTRCFPRVGEWPKWISYREGPACSPHHLAKAFS